MRWESSFSSVPYQKQYIFHTLLTQNAEVRIYKLHMHTHTNIHTKISDPFYDFLPSGEKTNVLALILPSNRNDFCEATRKDTCSYFFVLFLFLFSLDQVENVTGTCLIDGKLCEAALWSKMKVGNTDADSETILQFSRIQ